MFLMMSVFLGALLISLMLTPFCRDFFGFLGIVDRPDAGRKRHARPTPRVGGVSIMISFLLALGCLALAWKAGHLDFDPSMLRLMVGLLPVILLIFCIGLVDDIRGLSPRIKLLGQTFAAVYAVAMGVTIAMPGWYTDPSPSLLLGAGAVFWLVLCTNALNLIDGLDGLAGGVAVVACAGLIAVALVNGQPGLALVILPLMGALIGFLVFNFNPASIFLGDCGSLSVGFLLGIFGLLCSQKTHTGLGRVAPLLVLALPLLDVGMSIVRRVLRKQPVFSSDRNHIHHKVLTLGMSQSKAAQTLYLASAIAAITAVLVTTLPIAPALVVMAVFVVVASLSIRALGYTELGALVTFLLTGAFSSALRTRILIREYEAALAASSSVEGCWNALATVAREARFYFVALETMGQCFEHTFATPAQPVHFKVDLGVTGTADFAYDFGSVENAAMILPLAHRLQVRLHELNGAAVGVEPASNQRVSRVRAATVGS